MNIEPATQQKDEFYAVILERYSCHCDRTHGITKTSGQLFGCWGYQFISQLFSNEWSNFTLYVEYSIFLLQQNRVNYFTLPLHTSYYEYVYLIYIISGRYQCIRHCKIVPEARAC